MDVRQIAATVCYSYALDILADADIAYRIDASAAHRAALLHARLVFRDAEAECGKKPISNTA